MLELFELLLIVDCKLLIVPFSVEFIVLLNANELLTDFGWCNWAPGARLCELLFDPMLLVLADSELSALPFCNTLEKYWNDERNCFKTWTKCCCSRLTDNSFIFPSFIIGCGNAFEIISDNNCWGASGLSSSSPTPYAEIRISMLTWTTRERATYIEREQMHRKLNAGNNPAAGHHCI